MTDERFGYIDAALSFAKDFSDGAFMAFMEEKGISMEEMEEFIKIGKEKNHVGKGE